MDLANTAYFYDESLVSSVHRVEKKIPPETSRIHSYGTKRKKRTPEGMALKDR
jgi:hypothetical protein